MSNLKDKTSSDDEFEDALDDTSPASSSLKSDDPNIAELAAKHGDLKLSDTEEDETQTLHDAETSPKKEKVLDEDDIMEEELREREKDMTEEDLRNNQQEAEALKKEGNELFKNDDALGAIELYTNALRICPTSQPKDRAMLYGNRAAAKMKVASNKAAIEDCTRAIDLWPEYVRALLRRAKLFEGEDSLDEALKDFQRVNELDPGQPEARQAMMRLPPLIAERNERMKTEMMSKLKDLGNMILNPFGLSTENFQMQQDPKTGGYSVNFNQKR